MPRIALITTGDVEFSSLGKSLQRLFPEVDFAMEQTDSFTSTRVAYPPELPANRPKTNAEEMAARLVAAVDQGKSRERADFAIAIGDLELCNLDQPEVVIDVFHQAVGRYLEQSWPSSRRREKAYQTARDCCSFHLLVPMLEAYFFGDPEALKTIGAQATPQLQGNDLEDFLVSDAIYLASAKSEEQRPLLCRHPKKYLKFLLGGSYRETKQGKMALERLDWQKVLVRQHHVKYLRSLFVDVAEMLGHEPPFSGEVAPLTWNRAEIARLLRNSGPMTKTV